MLFSSYTFSQQNKTVFMSLSKESSQRNLTYTLLMKTDLIPVLQEISKWLLCSVLGYQLLNKDRRRLSYDIKINPYIS